MYLPANHVDALHPTLSLFEKVLLHIFLIILIMVKIRILSSWSSWHFHTCFIHHNDHRDVHLESERALFVHLSLYEVKGEPLIVKREGENENQNRSVINEVEAELDLNVYPVNKCWRRPGQERRFQRSNPQPSTRRAPSRNSLFSPLLPETEQKWNFQKWLFLFSFCHGSLSNGCWLRL